MIKNSGNFLINVESPELVDGVFTKVSKLRIYNLNNANSGIYECRAVVDNQRNSAKVEITIGTGNKIWKTFAKTFVFNNNIFI